MNSELTGAPVEPSSPESPRSPLSPGAPEFPGEPGLPAVPGLPYKKNKNKAKQKQTTWDPSQIERLVDALCSLRLAPSGVQDFQVVQ